MHTPHQALADRSPFKGKFSGPSAFVDKLQAYRLLPFDFERLDGDRYFLTNMAGEFVLASRPELQQIVDCSLSPVDRLYAELKAKHFIESGNSLAAPELLAVKVRTKADFIRRFTALHMFVVTLRCDHSCQYCQVSRQSEDRIAFDMSKDTAAAALDFTFKSPSPQIKIEFQGGESLLNFDLIRFIVEEAEARNSICGKDLQFVAASNLVPLSDEILSFAEGRPFYFSTSLDGPRDLHNRNRPRPGGDSHNFARTGIKRVRDRLGIDRVSALMTTTADSLARATDIVDEYLDAGFTGLFLRPLSPYGFAIKTRQYYNYQVDQWLEFYKSALSYIIRLNESGVRFQEYYTALILRKMLTPHPTGYVDLQNPSGIGISAIVFNYNGKVFASDEARMLAEMDDERFALGNLTQNTYEEIMLSPNLVDPIQVSVLESVPMCSDCAFRPYCGSDPVFHYATTGDFVGHKKFSPFCRRHMGMFKHIIGLMESSASTRELFEAWAWN